MPAASLDPTDADAAELLRLARGDAPDDRPYGVANRVRLESAGLIHRATRMRRDGLEVPDGYALTSAGWARVREIAGAGCRAPADGHSRGRNDVSPGMPEVAGAGGCIARSAPSHDHQQGTGHD